MIKTWITHGFEKICGSAVAPALCPLSHHLFMAKNEAEVCQIAFVSTEEKEVKLTLSGEVEGISVSLYQEYFVPAKGELWPDPLVPTDGNITLSATLPTVVMLEFSSSAETAAGDYTYTVTAASAGETLATYTVVLRVWNFALPVTPASQSAMSIQMGSLKQFHALPTREAEFAMMKQYYDMLLNHRISAYSVPYPLLDERADAYLSDPRVTAFCCDYEVGTYRSMDDDGMIQKIGQKIASNPEWLKKAYVYPLDEPRKPEHLTELKKRADRLHRLMPGIHLVIPFYVDLPVDENTDQVEFMSHLHDIWCPKARMFENLNGEDDTASYPDWYGDMIAKYPSFFDRMKDFQRRGDRVWWYVCNYPQPPYANLFLTDQGLISRGLFWLQYRYEVEGFLYWSVNCWRNLKNPWEGVDTFGDNIHGDGILFYPGAQVGIDGPVASHRLKTVRDGLEDFDLFTLAETVFGREKLVETVCSVFPNQTEVKTDNDGFAALRAQIGNALSEAMKS